MPLDPEVEAKVADITAGLVTGDEPRSVGIDSAAIEGAPVAIYSVDFSGSVRSWNHACEELFGWSADEAIGHPVPFITDDMMSSSLAGLEVLARGEPIPKVEFSPTRKDGRRIHVLTSAALLRDQNGLPSAILAFAIDVTEAHEAATRLAAAEYRWRRLVENISDTVTLLDQDGHIIETTGEFTDLLGEPPGDWPADGTPRLHPDDLSTARAQFAELMNGPGRSYRSVYRMMRPDGRPELVEYTVANLLDDPGVNGIIVTTRNVTSFKQAEALLADEARVLETVARGADLDETMLEVVRMVESHTGGRGGAFLLAGRPGSQSLRLVALGSLPDEIAQDITATPLDPTSGSLALAIERRRQVVIGDARLGGVNRREREAMDRHGLVATWGAPIVDTRTDDVVGTIAVFHDVPHDPSEHEQEVVRVATHLAAIAIERNRAQQELFHQARHHQLTGLPNRRSLIEALGLALERTRANQSRLALMFIDLDRFKVVNDSLGHAAGDKLLVRFGTRLRNLVRPGDYVSHFGADEFVVVLENVAGVQDVRFVANRLELALTEPFAIDEGEIFLSASIGVAVAEDGESPEIVLQHADTAMYRAKEKGRDRLEVFDEHLRSRATEHLRVDRDLRLAIERSELALHYQPKVDLQTGSIVGAEALLRWHHPDRGMTYPSDFIPIAEDTGLIVRIGRWVLEEAILQARAWSDTVPGLNDFVMAVNLSPRQISSPDLVATVARVLVRYDWPPHQLALELTERVLIDDAESTLLVLRQLKELGVKLAIDDFGTGYSSLSYLHRFPVDEVKLDRSFVTPLRESGEGSPVATAVTHMARALGILTCAEGVEEEGQLAGLRSLGCEQAQGYLFSRPAPSEALEASLRLAPRW